MNLLPLRDTQYSFVFHPATGPADVVVLNTAAEYAEFCIVSSSFQPGELVLLLKYYPEKGARFVQTVIRIRCKTRRSIPAICREAWAFGQHCQRSRRLVPGKMYRARPRQKKLYELACVPPPAPPARRFVDRVLMCEI